MQNRPTPLQDSFVLIPPLKEDERGFFSRLFCQKQWKILGLDTNFVQINNSFSAQKGTLRGMHYQLSPYQETKVVCCFKGAIYDVIIDLRKDSPTFLKHFGTILSESNRQMLYVPKGFAHGFLTLKPHSEIFYLVSEYYTPEYERGIRWNDPSFNIRWPEIPTIISDRDQKHPNFCAGKG